MASEYNPISPEKSLNKSKRNKTRAIKVDYNIVMNIQLPTGGEVGITLRGRPLMIWGEARRKSRKKNSEVLLQEKINLKRPSPGKNKPQFSKGIPA